MSNNSIASAEEVCRAITIDLRARGITHEEIGRIIGKSRSVVSNVLSSKKRFSKSMALLFSNAFGYSINYLLYGVGDMKLQDDFKGVAFVPSSPGNTTEEDIMVMACMIECAQNILGIVNDDNASSAWKSLSQGDFSGYVDAMKKLSTEHNKQMVSNVMAKYVCDHITGIMAIPIVSNPQ